MIIWLVYFFAWLRLQDETKIKNQSKQNKYADPGYRRTMYNFKADLVIVLKYYENSSNYIQMFFNQVNMKIHDRETFCSFVEFFPRTYCMGHTWR
jgi:hypothetical protein